MSNKRKATDSNSFPRWAHLLRFHPSDDANVSSAGDIPQSKSNSNSRDLRRRRLSIHVPPPPQSAVATTNISATRATATLEPSMNSRTQSSTNKSQSYSKFLHPSVSYPREDLYLRIEAYRYASAILDTILNESMTHVFMNQPSLNVSTSSSLLNSWIHFIQKFEPTTTKVVLDDDGNNDKNTSTSPLILHDNDDVDDKDDDNTRAKTTKATAATTTTNPFSSSTPKNTMNTSPSLQGKNYIYGYHPALLPITIFNFPSSLGLDRSYMIQLLSCQYKKRMTTMEKNDHHNHHPSHSISVIKPAICFLQYGSVLQYHHHYQNHPFTTEAQVRFRDKKTNNGKEDCAYSLDQPPMKKYFNALVTGCTLKDFLKEILKQCIAQEEPLVQESFQYLLQKDGMNLSSKKIQGLYHNRRIIKVQRLSYRQKIISWAQKTDSFHSIVVIVENPETIPLDILNQFITCISHLRCHDLVPIQLVLCSMAYDPSRWHSLECFTGNVVVKDIHVPSSTEVLNHFLDCLSSIPNEANDDDVIFPIILSKEVLLNLRGQFNDFHGSIVSFLYQMKSALAHHFARKGSFIAMTDVSSFTKYHGKRIAWFCSDPRARSYLLVPSSSPSSFNEDISTTIPSSTLLTFIDTALQDRRFLFLVVEMLHFFHGFLVHKSYINQIGVFSFTSLSLPTNAVEACVSSSDDYRRLVKDVLEKLGLLQLSELIIFMVYSAQFIQKYLDCTGKLLPFTKTVQDLIYSASHTQMLPLSGVLRDPTDRMRRLLQWVHENIILIHALLQETSNEYQGIHVMTKERRLILEKSLKEDIITTFGNLFHRISFDWCVSSPFSLFFSLADKRSNTIISGSSLLQSILAQPRRHVALGIYEKCSPDSSSIGNDVRAAISVLNSRIIDVITWFSLFINEIHQGDSTLRRFPESHSAMHQRFSFTVYQLIHMGMISKSRRSDDIYEKQAIVWVSNSS